MHKILSKHTELKIDHCLPELTELIIRKTRYLEEVKGNGSKYKKIVSNLPDITQSTFDSSGDTVIIGKDKDSDLSELKTLKKLLKNLKPWRKGPFSLFGIDIDTEWNSAIKWRRIQSSLAPLKNKRVLDVGCSSGYYMFKMLEENPFMILGVDPSTLFYYQFQALNKYARCENLFHIPCGLEELPVFDAYFDTVFYMGVIYHRKSPIETLEHIHANMKKGGELVLETLIIEDESDIALFPMDRYAKMRNVFFIPSLSCLENWMKRAGFKNIKCIDISRTTSNEQRKTDWIDTETLTDFLDPKDATKTVEGYPAPVRAVMIAYT
jgi:tRNA (mo5U34)-methyltransferase